MFNQVRYDQVGAKSRPAPPPSFGLQQILALVVGAGLIAGILCLAIFVVLPSTNPDGVAVPGREEQVFYPLPPNSLVMRTNFATPVRVQIDAVSEQVEVYSMPVTEGIHLVRSHLELERAYTLLAAPLCNQATSWNHPHPHSILKN